MTFDPFGDYAEAGYLRNRMALPLGKLLKQQEHRVFQANLPTTQDFLAVHKRQPGYDALLEVHLRLFLDLYPWAGQDRLALTPDRTVHKGETVFAMPQHLRKAFDNAMNSPTPGQALGSLAYCHPFLDGNGRAIFTFFDDYLRRKGRQLDWQSLPRDELLRGLDKQINNPTSDTLDFLLDEHITLITTGSRPASNLSNMQRKPTT